MKKKWINNFKTKDQMKAKNIHSLDSLEREIYRLKLEAKTIEDKIEANFDDLRENYSSIFMNSFKTKKKDTGEEKHGFYESFFKNEAFDTIVRKVSDHIADRAAEGIESLIDKIFDKKKHAH